MAAIPEPVKKCVAILKAAESDTEKLAALFMVTKLVKGESCTSAVRKLLFEAIGFKFLKRLLLTPDVQDCPPQVYKSVALSILSAFCKDPELATHPEMLSNLPMFLDIVQTSDADDYDDNLIVVSEAYECLLSIAATKAGQKALFDIGTVTKMSETYSHQSFQTDEALNLLVLLVSSFGPACWEGNPGAFHTLMNKITLDCETDQSERKFHLCDILNALLLNCKREIASTFGEDTTWPASIYKALYDILTSKIGKAQRDPALKLASSMTELLGPKWTMMDEDNPRKFFLLLVQLACVEVRMQLEDRGGLPGVMNNADLVTACFLLIESAISFVANEHVELEGREKQSLYTAMKGAFTAVITLLQKVQNDMNKKKTQLEVKEKVFICAMVRVLSAWMAQETSAMRNQIYELLPFMLLLANDTFYAYRARYMMERVRGPPGGSSSGETMDVEAEPLSQIDILRFMLPALCHLAVEEQARKILLDTKEDEILYESFAFHWSIVHYKKPPVPRSERLKVRKEEALDPKLIEDMSDSRTAMVSICNIFMNITVLEAQMVEESNLFSQLLKFILNNLPELRNIPENLVLHGNMAVLGLLLLKQQAKKIKKNDFSICRYIQATIRFLWDAYNVDESNDSTTLVVSMAYKEHWIQLMELWFLGMQTMSSVLSLIPWISEFAIESGWAEGIIDTLKKVKYGSLPPNTKSAYEDFLCHLVDANNCVSSVLKQRDALTVCRNHRLMELGKRLFED